MNDFGNYVRKKREEHGLLLREVAMKLAIDTPMLSKIERGVRALKKDRLEILSSVLELDLRELQTRWLAAKIYQNIRDEEFGVDALRIAEKELIQWGKKVKE